MTTLQKALLATTLAAAIGVGTYQARQASVLRAQVKTLQQQLIPAAEPPQAARLAALQAKVEASEAQNTQLASALTRANKRLETEREQARHSAALYKELIEQANSKDLNPTNQYPTPRHVWAAFGKIGRLSALSKEADGKQSPEEKAALDAAKIKALQDLPNLVKAFKQYDAAAPTGTNLPAEDRSDLMACVLYGALNLDEQQFDQVYGLMQKYTLEAKEKGLAETDSTPEMVALVKQMMEQSKADMRTILTPEQARIFADLLTHYQPETRHLDFNFSL